MPNYIGTTLTTAANAPSARTPADKANWLKIAEEWQKLAEDVDAASMTRNGLNK
jgi:hypothetical protein